MGSNAPRRRGSERHPQVAQDSMASTGNLRLLIVGIDGTASSSASDRCARSAFDARQRRALRSQSSRSGERCRDAVHGPPVLRPASRGAIARVRGTGRHPPREWHAVSRTSGIAPLGFRAAKLTETSADRLRGGARAARERHRGMLRVRWGGWARASAQRRWCAVPARETPRHPAGENPSRRTGAWRRAGTTPKSSPSRWPRGRTHGAPRGPSRLCVSLGELRGGGGNGLKGDLDQGLGGGGHGAGPRTLDFEQRRGPGDGRLSALEASGVAGAAVLSGGLFEAPLVVSSTGAGGWAERACRPRRSGAGWRTVV